MISFLASPMSALGEMKSFSRLHRFILLLL